MPYIFHVSILVAMCYCFYKILLSRETYFQLNRWVLVACLGLSFSLPFLEIPEDYSLRRVAQEGIVSQPIILPGQKNEKELQPIENKQIVKEVTDEKIAEITPILTTSESTFKLSFWEILQYIYLIGMGIFALNFLIQFFALFFQIIKNPRIKDGKFYIIEISKDVAPFSFLNCIFINPTKYDWETYNQILEHEKIHASQGHSIDIFIAELVIIFQWFNPFAWMYRKEIENNLEYLTDEKMLVRGNNRQMYQMNLLKVAVPNLPLNLTTNYNQSTLKKRILMMNAKKSSVRSSWKYLFLLPILGLSVLFLNAVKVNAQQINPEPLEIEELIEVQDLQDAEIEQAEEVEIADENELGDEEVADPVEYMNLVGFEDVQYFEDGYKGNWSAEIEGDKLCVQFIKIYDEKRQHIWARHNCYPLTKFGQLPVNKEGEFKYSGEAGTVTFSGKFKGSENGDEGEGTYEFQENPAFRTYLTSKGFSDISEETLFHCVLSDIDKSYFDYLKSRGYETISDDELKALAVHNLSQERIEYYLAGFRKNGITNLKIKDLIALEIHDVSVEYVSEMKDLLNEDLTFDDVVKASIHDINPDYIREFKAAGYDDLDFDDLVKFAIHDIDVEYIGELKNTFGDMSEDEIVKAGIHDIDADYIKEFRAAGFDDLDFDDMVKYAIHDIDVEYIDELKKTFGKNLSEEEIVAAAIHDIDADYIKKFKEAGFENLDFEDMVGFAIHDIDTEYIKELKAAGFEDLDKDEIIGFAIHDIDADYIKEFQQAGFEDLDFEDIVGFAIHNIDVDFIQEYKKLGFQNLDKEDLIKLGIHDIDADFIKDLESVGFKNLDIDDLVKAGIHDVDGDYIKKMRERGKNYEDLEDYIRLKIHDGHHHRRSY